MPTPPTAPSPGDSPNDRPTRLEDWSEELRATQVRGAVRPPAPPPGPADAPVGEVGGTPFGRYRLIERLGMGGMGVVWKAWDTHLKRVVALKQILGGESGVTPDLRERFLREAQLAAKLKHPNIVGVHDVGEHDGQPFFTSEYIAGRPLSSRLGDDVPLRTILSWVRDLALALQYAHDQGVVHRDIKPGNILVDEQGRPQVMDFGLAKDVHLAAKSGSAARALTASGDLVGTPDYMSPEQACGEIDRIGPATDQFSLGVILYEALTRQMPFHGDNLRDLLNAIVRTDPRPPRQVAAQVPVDVETVCGKALEKEPERRYPSLKEMAADLQRVLDGEPILARPLSLPSRILRRAFKFRRVVLPTLLAIVAVVGWGVYALALHALRARDVAAAMAKGAREEAAAAATRHPEEVWNRLVAARDAYQRATTLDPRDAAAAASLQRVEQPLQAMEIERRGTQEAWKLLEQARPALEKTLRYLYSPQYEYEELVRRAEAAREPVEQALGLAPNLAAAHYLAGRIHDLEGDEGAARQAYARAIRLDDTFGPAHGQLGRSLLVRAFVTSWAWPGEDPATRAQVLKRDLTDAAREMRRGLELGGGSGGFEEEALPREELEATLQCLETGDLERLRVACGAALARLPNAEGREELYWLKAALETGAARQDALAKAIEIRPHFGVALLCRAVHRQEGGEFAGAADDLDQALRIHPRLAAAWSRRGSLRQAGGDRDGARADYARCLEVAAADWPHRDVVAARLLELGGR